VHRDTEETPMPVGKAFRSVVRRTVRACGVIPSIVVVVLAAFGALATPAAAQTWPQRPIRLVIPWPPGQATDLVARIVADKLTVALGQPVVADNRAGAGGMIGTEIVAKAAPDGYTILAASSGPITINPLVQKTPYDVEKQLVAVHNLAAAQYLLVAAAAFPAKDITEFLALLRANPGKYTFSSSGTGATTHLLVEWFNSLAGIQATHVPYKGSAPALTDVMAGQVHYTIETLASTVTHVKSGRLRAYGISTARRSTALPDIVPIREGANLPTYDIAAWIGYMAPAGTPREIVQRLSQESEKALAMPDVRERFASLGLEPDSIRADDFGPFIRLQTQRYGEVVKRSNIRVD
jgi:tripartite-type tricarboxylate transporter receptor subunit TctC